MAEYEDIYEVRYTDKGGEEVTELRTGDEELAKSKREELISKGFKQPHIQYSFKEGGEIQTSLWGLTEVSEDNPNGLVIDKVITNLNKKYNHLDISDMPIGTPQQKQQQRDDTLKWIFDNKATVLIAFSGGKDSVAMVLHALFDLKIPKDQIELWHHEVDGMAEQLFDWKCTESYCKAFAKEFGLKLLFSYSEGGILKGINRENELPPSIFFQKEVDGEFTEIKPRGWDSDVNSRLKFPAVTANLTKRWCSALAKIDVMGKSIRNWDRFDKGHFVIMTGERRLESKNRACYNEIEPTKYANENRKMINWRSVIDWTEEDVWNIYKEHGVQPHPCYELGWSRCSCQLCIFSSPDTWASINELNPEKVARIAEIEKDIGKRGEKIIAAQIADPSLIKLGKDKETGEMIPKPFVNTPYLYGDKVKVEELIPAHQKTDKKGKVRNYKAKMGMVWTGERKDIYGSRVNDGKSFLTPAAKARWEKEANGEFVSPIIVEDWKLPQGAFNTEKSGAS
jgi:3'-phosphoadenosine 5'-phosphosulfate sulfotransferase (PAPS reductase)/FAD synthetase